MTRPVRILCYAASAVVVAVVVLSLARFVPPASWRRVTGPAPGGAIPAAGPVDTDDFTPVRVVPRIDPITEFPTVAVAEVGDRILPTEAVLGVEVDGEARAYPINMLTGPMREILNDELGGRPIAATW